MRLIPLALLALTTLPIAAQSKISNALLEETIIQSGTASQFEPAHKDYCAAVVKGGAPACLIFSTATFGQSNLYFTLLPFGSFVHYDQGKYTDKGLTPDEAKRSTPAAFRPSPPTTSTPSLSIGTSPSFPRQPSPTPISLSTSSPSTVSAPAPSTNSSIPSAV
jgi:hypothetical protein